ncbi:MAG: site-specific integrase [Lachnospiraceae bacterium]|nr:site-specific integrase [Lachnospiraceae bacterium]
MDIVSIDVIVIKEWFLKVIEKYELSSRKYKEMKSFANMLLDYAVEKRLVSTNVSRSVHGISNKKFTEPPRKEVTEQVYIDDEAKLLIEEAERHYKKTHNVACLAICLNFSLALRVGELVALQTNDFTDSWVKIDRQEVKTYYVDENNICRRNGYEISCHTKTKMGKRELYLSADAKRYLSMILEHNKNSGFNSKYLLLDENGERLHEFAINNVLRELNRKIGTAQKSNHKIRKTCISNLISSGQLTNEEIRVFAGHEDFATTEKYYEFPINSMDKRADAYEKALSYTKKCNQL